MNDPTYNRGEIDANLAWQIAFSLSEMLNDDAPIGWSHYIPAANNLLKKYAITPKTT